MTERSGPAPLVSVVITTYNQDRYIADTIASVLAQTYRQREVIVVDDESTDTTPAVLAAFGPAIRVIRQTNAGVAGARNRGVQEARGELIAFMDGDDLWSARKLERQVDAFLRFPDSGIVACDVTIFENTTTTCPSVFATKPIWTRLTADLVNLAAFELLVDDNFLATTTQVMVPATVLQQVGSSDSSLPVGSDYDLYLRIAARRSVTLVNEPLAHWRYLQTSASGPARLRQFRWTEDLIHVLRMQLPAAPAEYRSSMRRSITDKSRAIASEAYRYADTDRQWARRYLWRLFRQARDVQVGFYLCGAYAPSWMRTIVAAALNVVLGKRPQN